MQRTVFSSTSTWRIRALVAALVLLAAACSEQKSAPTAKPGQPPAPKPAGPATVAEKTTPGQPPAAPQKISTLVAYYHFDEDAGATAVADATGRFPGRPNAGVSFGAKGEVKTAAEFSRAQAGQITVGEPLGLNTNTVTMALWVKRRGPQAPATPLVFCRGGDLVTGLQIGAGQDLGYVWDRTGRGAWKSGLVLPEGVWTFVALVVEPAQATLYLGVPGSPLRKAAREASHAIAEFSGPLTLGRDPIDAVAFEGGLDELGIWKNAMSEAELDRLFQAAQQFGKVQAAPPAGAEPSGRRAATSTARAGSGWSDPDFERAAALYNDAINAFQQFLQTRQNPAVLKRIEDNLRVCVDLFERSKRRAPAGVDVQEYIDRCNKVLFDVQATRQVGR